MLRYRVVQRRLPLLDQPHHRRRRELFRHGSELEHRVGGGGDVVLHVRQPVRLHLDRLAVPDDRQRDGRDVVLFELRAGVIVDRIGPSEGDDEHCKERERAGGWACGIASLRKARMELNKRARRASTYKQ